MAKSWNLLRKRLIASLEPYGAVSEFCRKTGFSRTAVDNWMNNVAIPNLEHIDKIADALGYRPDQLISEGGHPIHKAHTMEDCYRTLGDAVRYWNENDDGPPLLKASEPKGSHS